MEVSINFHAHFQNFFQIARVSQRRELFTRTLKMRMEINALFNEDSWRLRVYDIEGNFPKTIEAQLTDSAALFYRLKITRAKIDKNSKKELAE